MINFITNARPKPLPNGRNEFYLDLQQYLEESGSSNIVDDKTFIGSVIKVNGAEYKVISWTLDEDGIWAVECEWVEGFT